MEELVIGKLPCVKCGAGLSLVEGSTVQCFACGTVNGYMESYDLLLQYLREILETPSEGISKEQKVSKQEVEKRKGLIESVFNEKIAKSAYYSHIVITKLDDVEFNQEELLALAKDFGNIEIITNDYVLPYVEGGLYKSEFREIINTSYIYNNSLLALYHSYLAKIKHKLEDSNVFYQLAERNFENILSYCESLKGESVNLELEPLKIIFSAALEFCKLLRKFLIENPNYSSEKLEDLVKNLKEVKEKDNRVVTLIEQIDMIYKLGTDARFILEEIRKREIFRDFDPFREDFFKFFGDIVEKSDHVKKWIEDISERYQTHQKNLLKLHLGKFIEYLKTYREEFNNRRKKVVEKYNTTLEQIIKNAISSYIMETIEMIDILVDFMDKIELSDETIINRFTIEHDDLIKLDESLKSFIIQIFKKSIEKNLDKEYYPELLNSLASKHADFDKKILKYIYKLLKDFEDYRNKNKLSLEEQRNQFILELQPKIKRIIDASFTLTEDLIPYPLFLEVVSLTKELKVEEEQTISLLLENPSPIADIKNVNISFFVPRSFKSSLRYMQLNKIKPNQKKQISTQITPTESGKFHFMAMIEYKNVGESFWMPSITMEFTVTEDF